MIATAEQSVAPKKEPGAPQPPPLENGDRLTSMEFLHRYEAMPHVKKAELIEGIVIMASPVRTDTHSDPDSLVQTWLGNYAIATPGVKSSTNGTIRLDSDNTMQPDGSLRLLSGQTRLEDGYLKGCPELVLEVAASTASIALHSKLNMYRRHGAREYIAWRTFDAQLDWFVLKDEQFTLLQPDKDGIIRSSVFLGLWLNVGALLREDGVGVMETLQKGLGSPEHAAFVESLKANTKPA